MRIKNKMRLVRFLNYIFPRKYVPKIAIFISNNFGWIFG